ncbi:MAG: cyclic nucleotide-binding domain-containing protein [Acidimicrobiales bacterium]|mgnify:CR=1 FL=1|nr:cyclic nucleotide-binding domain-containing protein [Acidimicrobiales bacterium]
MAFRHHDPVAERLVTLGLDRVTATRLSRAGTFMAVDPGTPLCVEGERGRQAFLLLDGSAEVRHGDEVVEIGPGDVTGEQATVDHERRRNATVVARTAATVLVFDAATYRALARDDSLRPLLLPARPAA